MFLSQSPNNVRWEQAKLIDGDILIDNWCSEEECAIHSPNVTHLEDVAITVR